MTINTNSPDLQTHPQPIGLWVWGCICEHYYLDNGKATLSWNKPDSTGCHEWACGWLRLDQDAIQTTDPDVPCIASFTETSDWFDDDTKTLHVCIRCEIVVATQDGGYGEHIDTACNGCWATLMRTRQMERDAYEAYPDWWTQDIPGRCWVCYEWTRWANIVNGIESFQHPDCDMFPHGNDLYHIVVGGYEHDFDNAELTTYRRSLAILNGVDNAIL